MSVDYYFACLACGSCIHVAQDGLSGWAFYSAEADCMKQLGQWLGRHSLSPCSVTLLPEHLVEDYEQFEWRRFPDPMSER